MRYKTKDRYVEGWSVRELLDLAQADWASLPEPVRKAYDDGKVMFGAKSIWVDGLEAKADEHVVQVIWDAPNLPYFLLVKRAEEWNKAYDPIVPRTIVDVRRDAISSLLALPEADADMVISDYREAREASRVASASEKGISS